MSLLTTTIQRFIGASSDNKPILEQKDVGSEFFEADTKVWYVWSGKDWKLFRSSVLDMALPDLFNTVNDILEEIKKVNFQLADMTDTKLGD